MIYLENLSKAYALCKYHVPGPAVSKKELLARLRLLAQAIRLCPKKLCVQEIAKLLNVNEYALKRLIAGHILLFRNYYMIPATVKNKAAADLINLKIREDPLPYLALVLALIRFSGISRDLQNINPYIFEYKSKLLPAKLVLPADVRSEHIALTKITRSHIDMYPDTLLFLITNYAGEYTPAKRGGHAAIDILFYLLAERVNVRKIQMFLHNGVENDLQESFPNVDEKDILQCEQDPEIERDEVSMAAQGSA